jgi:acyl carrier protein
MAKFIKPERIKDTIAVATGININSVQNNDSLFESGILDSLNAIEVIEALEKEFQIKFKTEDLNEKNFNTVSSMTDFISNLPNIDLDT